MNVEIIFEVSHATLGGTLSFPDAVGKLMGAGVEYYHVDYVRLRKTFYSAEGRTVTVPIAFDALPPVAPELDVAALRANILDSQRNGQPFREFTRRAMAGGVQGYIAFLRGKRVTYWVATASSTWNGFRGRSRKIIEMILFAFHNQSDFIRRKNSAGLTIGMP
ncbi:MAG TPA: DUF1398 domain-containing protein [Verrucomicrobiae bacterium]|jgi:uncharacterized protein YbcV (DUF1398 family)|nr:DUF1398 domain-containing protein [Verrucomicrobiae bacterium]